MADDFDQLMLKYGAAPSQLPKQNTSYIPGGYTGGAGNKASGDDDFDSLMRQYYVEPSPGMRTTLTDEGMQQAAETAKLKHEWNKLQDEWSEYTRGRGNRSYLRQDYGTGSYTEGMQAVQRRRQQQEWQKANADYESALQEYNKAAEATRRVSAVAGPVSPEKQREIDAARSTEQRLKDRMDALKANADALQVNDSGFTDWEGRDALVEEYTQLQMELEHQSRRSPERLARFDEVKRQLQEGDQKAGNGAADYSFRDRSASIFGGTAKRVAGGVANTALTAVDFTAKYNPYLNIARAVNNRFGNVSENPTTFRSGMDKLYAAADRISNSAAADIERAKNGLGKLGQAGVDIAENVLEMGFDAAVGAATGGGSLVSMFARVFGDSAREARQQGATLEQQVGYGIAAGGIEVLTEKLFDGVAGIYGKGAADNITETVIRRLSSTPTGQTMLRGLIGAINEGNEEVLSDLLNPLAQAIYREDSIGQLYRELDPSEVLYDFLIGAAVGGLGGVTSVATGQSRALNAENSYISAMYEQAGEKPSFGREVRDRAILERQWTNPDAYDAANLSTKENAQEAMRALRGKQTESERAQELQQTQRIMQDEYNGKLLTTVFSSAGIDLTDDERTALMGLVNDGTAKIDGRILGMRDAYKAGESGQKLADVMLEMEGRGLTFNQIAQAWKAGANVQTDVTGPVDVNTKEGRATLEANLAPLGTHIDAAIDAYDGKQDAARYSAAMQKAAFLYAANGADLTKIVQDARDGKVADIVGYLTDEQVKIAQDIGNEQRAQIREAEQTAAARTQELQEQAAAITKGQTVTAQALAEIDTAIDVANKASQRAVDTINQTVANLEAMVKANPKAAQSEAYKKAYDAAMQQKKKIQGLQNTVTELRRRKAELEGRKTIQRKKGTVSFAGGTVDKVKYDGVDQTKLTRQQKKVVAMVERLADAVNLDYVFISADPGMGGAYVRGGTVYVNINSGMGVGDFSQTMAAASLSHELTHWMQEYAPEQYRELKDFIVSEILKADPQELNRLVQQQQRWEKGRSLSYEQALDEVVANACQTMLLDSEAIAKLARQNMTLAERIRDFIEDWSNKIKEAFAEVDTSKGAIYDSLRAVEGSLDRIQELWDNGIEAAAQNYDAQQTAQEADVAQEATNENAAQNIGDVQNQTWSEAEEDYRQEQELETQIREAEDALDFEEDEKVRRSLENRLVKLRADYDKLVAKERRLSKKTSIDEILNNLRRYRYNDLESIANQFSDGAWDIEPGTPREQLEEELREALEERAADMTPLQRQAPREGFFVRPVESGQRFQYIGESAETADKDALARARELDKQGVDNESIRQQTGWFKGMDGKWRFEIPGNRMEYYRFGDARFRQDHPEYAEYQDLMDRVLTGELTKADEKRVAELDKMWGNETGRLSQIVERGNATLDMILRFDDLFEAYPQLREIRVEFDDLGKQGLGGSYDDKRKSIVLGNHLKRDPIRAKAILAHEIQHAIQHIEGFTPGASPEYWSYRLNAGYRQEVEKKADQKYNELFDAAPEELKNKIRAYNRARIDKNWELADELENELYDSEYADLFSAIDNADFERRNARYAEYNPVDMYFNTAGEIEARDAERRSIWDESKRKLIPPNLGNSKTIFSNWDDGPQFQRWDNTDGDTAAEANGREEAYTRLQSENKAVEDTIAALRKLTEKQGSTIERLQKRLRLTTTPEVREADARKLARNLVKEYGSGADVSGISEQLKALGDYVVQTKDLNADEVKNRAREIARGIVESASEQVSFEDEALSGIRDSIKGKKLTISTDFLGELDQDDGFDAFRKRNFGAFTLARADSTSIDRSEYTSVSQFYTDLQSEYGKAYFPDLANEGEEIRTIAEFARAAAPMEVNPFEQYMGEATEELANRISMEVMDGALRLTPATDADKAKSRREALQERIRELQREGKIQEREAKDYERTIQELTDTLDKDQSRYRTLQVTAEQRMAQVRAEGRARQIEIKAKEREKAAENIKALKDHFRDMSRKARERRTNTATRRNIRKLIADLNNRLKHPTENKHIPRELMQITLDVLNMIDMDTGRGGTQAAQKLADIRALYESYKTNPTYQIAYDETTADMLDQLPLTLRGTRLADMNELQLKAVHDTLKSLIHVIDTAVRIKIGTEEYNAYELSREMTMETRAVPKAQRGWLREHLIPAHLRADVAFRRFGGFKKNSKWEQAAKLLNDGQLKETRLKMELSRPFAEIFNDEKALADFTGVNALGKVDTKKLVDIGLKDANGEAILVNHDLMVGIYMDLLNEDNRRHFINGGKTIPNIADFYSGKGGWGAGAQRSAGIAERLSELNRQLSEAERTNYGEWADDLKDQIAALKSEGEQYADKVQAAVESKLTDYDREWIAACKQLMDVDSKRELNRTTMDVYGIEKASVPDYWPITSDPDFLSKPMETVTKDMSLENVGFMKDRIKGANPSLALGTVNVVTRQIDRVSHYCGMMPALRSFGKIWNKTEAGYADSIKKATREVFQDSGVKYVENLIADLTGGRTIDRDILGLDAALGKLRGNLAQTSLTLNIRVAMAQAASYPTAAAELGWGPLAKALARGGKNGQIISRADTDLIAKWSPLLYHRMQGYSSPELGDIQSGTSATSKLWRKARWITGWIQAVDGATVGRLWYAAEYWVQDNKPTLQKGSDAYYEAVAEKFNAVVEKTQPNYTPMQRAAILREPSNLVKTFTMFMTQRLQNYNILYDAAGSYQKARADFANGRNGVTQADVSEARQNVARAVTSQLAQAAVYVGFKVLADVLLHNMKKYRDDDTGDFTAESVSKAILDAYLEAWMGIGIFGSELYSIIKAATGVSKWYGLSVSGVDSVNDLIENVVKLAQNDWTTDSGKENGRKTLLKVGTSLAQALGIPLQNGIKLGEAVFNHIMDAVNGEMFSFEAGYERTKKQNTEKLIHALESGDKDMISELVSVFKDEKAALSAVKDRLKDDYMSEERSEEEVVKLLVTAGMKENDAWFYTEKLSGSIKQAALNGDSEAYKQELEQLTSHGVKEKDVQSNIKSFLKKAFTGEDLSTSESEILGDRQITAEEAQKILTDYCGLDENEAYLTLKSWETGDSGKYIAAQRAAFTGDQAAFKAEMQDLASHGVKEKDVRSAVKGFVRDAFMGKELSEEQSEIVGDRQLTEADARKMLHYYAGLSVDDANKAVAEWKEDMRIAEKYGAEYEKYDLTTAQAKYFYEGDAKGKVTLSDYAKQLESYGMDRVKAYYGTDGWRQTGLTMDQYDKYATEASKCKGVDNDGDGKADANTVKNQKLAIINSLPVSPAVKDAIYRKNNWAESGLKNTPWH